MKHLFFRIPYWTCISTLNIFFLKEINYFYVSISVTVLLLRIGYNECTVATKC